jgi:hypothetical protein
LCILFLNLKQIILHKNTSSEKILFKISTNCFSLSVSCDFAGAFVRLTGSGMGCPDWPKCFGYYIPPTEQSELLFTAAKEYDKGQVIIKSLLVAKADFVSNPISTQLTGKNTQNMIMLF